MYSPTAAPAAVSHGKRAKIHVRRAHHIAQKSSSSKQNANEYNHQHVTRPWPCFVCYCYCNIVDEKESAVKSNGSPNRVGAKPRPKWAHVHRSLMKHTAKHTRYRLYPPSGYVLNIKGLCIHLIKKEGVWLFCLCAVLVWCSSMLQCQQNDRATVGRVFRGGIIPCTLMSQTQTNETGIAGRPILIGLSIIYQ